MLPSVRPSMVEGQNSDTKLCRCNGPPVVTPAGSGPDGLSGLAEARRAVRPSRITSFGWSRAPGCDQAPDAGTEPGCAQGAGVVPIWTILPLFTWYMKIVPPETLPLGRNFSVFVTPTYEFVARKLLIDDGGMLPALMAARRKLVEP